MNSRKPKTVSAYIQTAPKEARAKLKEMRTCVRGAARGATEAIKWNMPAVISSRILVMYGGFKRHIGFFPTPGAMAPFKKELSKYKTGRGSIQFPLDKPLPKALIHRITATRVHQVKKQDGKWRS